MSDKYLPSIFYDLIKKFEKFPGIGKKSAERFVLFLANLPKNDIDDLINDLYALKENVHLCEICFNFTEKSNICKICSDERRDKSKICIVEDAKDIHYIERTGKYNGLYHVLGGKLSPMNGINPEDLHIRELISRIDDNPNIKEIMIATSTDTDGNVTAIYISQLLENKNINIYRLATGIPLGSSVNVADLSTISQAIQNKQKIK